MVSAPRVKTGDEQAASNRIYVQNGARRSHGVAYPNLSLAAWHSAVIINSLLDREHYSFKEEDITLCLDW